PAQMLMFLTRLGHDSRMIVTGDASQVDLPPEVPSGLIDAMKRLRGIKGIADVWLEQGDIVRHRLVQSIVSAYDAAGPRSTDGPHPRRRADARIPPASGAKIAPQVPSH